MLLLLDVSQLYMDRIVWLLRNLLLLLLPLCYAAAHRCRSFSSFAAGVWPSITNTGRQP
jgi:hypothetical protein